MLGKWKYKIELDLLVVILFVRNGIPTFQFCNSNSQYNVFKPGQVNVSKLYCTLMLYNLVLCIFYIWFYFSVLALFLSTTLIVTTYIWGGKTATIHVTDVAATFTGFGKLTRPLCLKIAHDSTHLGETRLWIGWHTTLFFSLFQVLLTSLFLYILFVYSWFLFPSHFV